MIVSAFGLNCPLPEKSVPETGKADGGKVKEGAAMIVPLTCLG